MAVNVTCDHQMELTINLPSAHIVIPPTVSPRAMPLVTANVTSTDAVVLDTAIRWEWTLEAVDQDPVLATIIPAVGFPGIHTQAVSFRPPSCGVFKLSVLGRDGCSAARQSTMLRIDCDPRANVSAAASDHETVWDAGTRTWPFLQLRVNMTNRIPNATFPGAAYEWTVLPTDDQPQYFFASSRFEPFAALQLLSPGSLLLAVSTHDGQTFPTTTAVEYVYDTLTVEAVCPSVAFTRLPERPVAGEPLYLIGHNAATYDWRLVSRPLGSTAVVDAVNATKEELVFFGDVSGAYTFEVETTQPGCTTVTALTTITVGLACGSQESAGWAPVSLCGFFAWGGWGGVYDLFPPFVSAAEFGCGLRVVHRGAVSVCCRAQCGQPRLVPVQHLPKPVPVHQRAAEVRVPTVRRSKRH